MGPRAIRLATPCLAALVWLGAPAAALAGHDDDHERGDVRAAGRCTGGGTVALRVREGDDDELHLELRVTTPRPRERWTVVIVHERRLVLRAGGRAARNGRLVMRRTIPDWFGDDAVVVRATGSRGETCRVSARVPDD